MARILDPFTPRPLIMRPSGSALVGGLRYVYTFAEKGGTRFNSVMGDARGDFVGSPTWARGGLTTAGAGTDPETLTGGVWPQNTWILGGSPTIGVLFYMNSAPALAACPVQIAGSAVDALHLNYDPTNTRLDFILSGVAALSPFSASSFPVGAYYAAIYAYQRGVRVDAVRRNFTDRTILIGAATSASTPTSVSQSCRASNFSNGVNSGIVLNGTLYGLFLWNRPLSVAAMQQWVLDPFGVLELGSQRKTRAVTAPASGSTVRNGDFNISLA